MAKFSDLSTNLKAMFNNLFGSTSGRIGFLLYEYNYVVQGEYRNDLDPSFSCFSDCYFIAVGRRYGREAEAYFGFMIDEKEREFYIAFPNDEGDLAYDLEWVFPLDEDMNIEFFVDELEIDGATERQDLRLLIEYLLDVIENPNDIPEHLARWRVHQQETVSG